MLCSITIQAESLYWNKGRGYHPFRYATENGILIENNTDTLKYDYFPLPRESWGLNWSFRAKNLNGHPSKKYSYIDKTGRKNKLQRPHWGFFLVFPGDTIAVNVRGVEKTNIIESTAALEFNVFKLRENKKIISKTREERLNPFDGDNLFKINIANGVMTCFIGNSGVSEIFSFPIEEPILGIGYYAGWGDSLMISDISIKFDESNIKSSPLSSQDISTRIKDNKDDMEGYWTIFDRELEESLIKLGGRYKLACIREGENYQFLYMDGAEVNSSQWIPGDVKIELLPTEFEGIYDVIWFDASKQPMKKDIKAQIEEGNILSVQFPYHSSKLRLRKIQEN